MKIKVVSQYKSHKLDAGPKAKLDIERILSTEFHAKIATLKMPEIKSKKDLFFFRIKKAFFMIKNLIPCDVLIIQAPFSKNSKINIPAKKKIAFVHDIEGIRQKDEKILETELNFYKKCDAIIVHNNKMKEELEKYGLQKMYVLELFDYLVDKKEEKKFENKQDLPVIAYAGNLKKSPFLKQLKPEKINYYLHLYGIGITNDLNKKILYKGSFKPDELPKKIEAQLGLVWDGAYDDSDESELLKNYTKYNNPHKLSCYIASGLPVIVWKNSAIAQFVEKENIGYVINNLYEINNLDLSSLKEKKENVLKIQNKVINGYYTKRVVTKVLKEVS